MKKVVMKKHKKESKNIENKYKIEKNKIINNKIYPSKLRKYIKLQDLKQKEKVYEIKEKYKKKVILSNNHFIRNELKQNNNNYIPTTNIITPIYRKLNSSLFHKFIEFKGFRTYNKKRFKTEILDNIESVINPITNDNYKILKIDKNLINKSEKKKEKLISLNKYQIQNNISNLSTTYRTYSKTNRTINNSLNVQKNLRTLKNKVNNLLTDYKIFDTFLKDKLNINGKNNFSIKNKSETLKSRNNNINIENFKTLPRKIKQKKDEEFYTEKLRHIPIVAKKFFRNVYKQILYEQRILNKEPKNLDRFFIIKKIKDKYKQEFKIASKERMKAFGDNYVTEKDDKLILEEAKRNVKKYLSLE